MHLITGPFSKISFEPYNLNSPTQLKEFLYTLGWKPDEWNYNKETKERTSPKITLSSLESIGINDFGKWLQRYYVLKHRRGILSNPTDPENKGLLSYVDERGRISAEGITCGTPTGRYRHLPPIVNIPKAIWSIPYGPEIRSIFICREPYIMCGSDLSGIEARLLGHFTTQFDGGEMARLLLAGDIHSKTAKEMGIDRNTAKTIRYALMYGAGVGKVASILSCNTKEATKAVTLFYEANPALKQLVDALKRYYKKYGYIKSIDGRRISVRSEHSLLNFLIQSSAAVLFKRWGVYIWDEIDRLGIDAVVIIAMHDEYQIRVHQDCKEQIGKVLKDTLQRVQDKYNIRVELKTETSFGRSWRDTH